VRGVAAGVESASSLHPGAGTGYFVGHPVAVVVATDRYVAKDAADLIEIDWDVPTPLPIRRKRSPRVRRRCIRMAG